MHHPLPIQLCVCLIALFLASMFAAVAADYSLVVKGGDYVEWKTTIVGRPIRNVTGARMDILNVEDELIFVRVSIFSTNGSVNVAEYTYNELRGSMGDDLIVPRNLNIGDQFFDKYVGNITISGIGHMSFGSAKRTVMFATMRNTTFTWDRETGVLVNATSSYARPSGKSVINTQMIGTNIWQPDIIGLEPTVFYEIVAGVIFAVALVVAMLVVRRIKRARRARGPMGKGAYWQREFEPVKLFLPWGVLARYYCFGYVLIAAILLIS
jgi:hypothetical protein